MAEEVRVSRAEEGGGPPSDLPASSGSPQVLEVVGDTSVKLAGVVED